MSEDSIHTESSASSGPDQQCLGGGADSRGVEGCSSVFKSFWFVVDEKVLEVLNDNLDSGCLPSSCRRAVIMLLPKKGDLQQLKIEKCHVNLGFFFWDVSGSLRVETGFISIDQEAFERVEHLWHMLQAFVFSPGFIAMIQVLYHDNESMVKLNRCFECPF